MDIDFETAFIGHDSLTGEQEIELEVKGFDVSIFEGNEIDLGEVAKEQIVLSLPGQIFCREDCKGLCPECGVNKNLKSCTCEETAVGSRWSALSEIKIDKDK